MLEHFVDIAVRIVVVYVGLLVLLRLGGRREFSQLSPMDLLAMLLLSETVSPAMTAGATDLPTGLFAAAVLVGLTVLLNTLTARFPAFERVVDGTALCLIKDGVVDARTLRQLRITDEVLKSALHENGLERVDDVRRAWVEPDGVITMIPRAPPA